MGDEEEPTIFYVHKDTGEKLWEASPPAGEEHLYEVWEYDSATGDVSQHSAEKDTATPQPPPLSGPRPPSPGSRSASEDDGMESRSASEEEEEGGVVPLPHRAKPPPPVEVTAARGPTPPSAPAPPELGADSVSGSDSEEDGGHVPARQRSATAPPSVAGGGGRGPRPPPGPPPVEQTPPMYLETSLLAASAEERRLLEQGRTGQLMDSDFDRLAEQHQARRRAKLHSGDGSPGLRPDRYMPKPKTEFFDTSKYGVDEAIRHAATMDFATAILHDETCSVTVQPEHKVVEQQGKLVTYYAIDVASEAKGEWRVYRRFRQFEKLHDWMKKSEIEVTVKDTLKSMFPPKTWREATPAEVELRKVRLKEYLIRMYSDPDLKAQAQVQDSVFKNFLCHQGQDQEEGGGVRFSQFVRVRRVGVGDREDDRWSPNSNPRQERETLIELMLQRGITSKESRDRSKDGVLAGGSAKRLMAKRAELDLILDIDELKELAKEEQLDIPEEEINAARRFVWLEPYEVDSAAQTAQSEEESQKGTMLSFTEAKEGETKEEIAAMVKRGERSAIRTMQINKCKLNPEPKLRSCCAIELVLPEATVRFYTGSELAWIHWMGLLAPLLDRTLQSEYFDGQEFRGYVDQGVERLNARELVPDHSRVGKAAEYAEFTYGRVKRTFQENDPETMAKIKDAMDALGLDIDEAFRRVRGSGAGDDTPRLVSPGVRAAENGDMVGGLEKVLGASFGDLSDELRASIAAVRKRRYSVSSNMSSSMLSEDVIVIDCGSSYLRIGVGGEELPRKVVKMEGGRIIGGEKLKKIAYKGGSAGAQKRIEVDWFGLQQIFAVALEELEIDPTKHKFVLTSLSDLNPETTTRLREWLHDDIGVPCVAVVSAAAAILTASSRQTGIVLDIGNRTEITAICHGRNVSGAYKFFWFGGFDLTDKMQQLMARAQIDSSDLDLVRKVKESHCRLRDHSEDEGLSTRAEEWDRDELHVMPVHPDIPPDLALAPPHLWDCPVRVDTLSRPRPLVSVVHSLTRWCGRGCAGDAVQQYQCRPRCPRVHR